MLKSEISRGKKYMNELHGTRKKQFSRKFKLAQALKESLQFTKTPCQGVIKFEGFNLNLKCKNVGILE